MNYNSLTIDQKINLRMAELVLHYILTKHSALRRIVPSNCKTSAVYNTCYDFGKNYVDNDLVNSILAKSSDRAKEFILKGLPKHKYLKVELVIGSRPNQFKHSFTDELPRGYKHLERTSFVKWMKVEDVKVEV